MRATLLFAAAIGDFCSRIRPYTAPAPSCEPDGVYPVRADEGRVSEPSGWLYFETSRTAGDEAPVRSSDRRTRARSGWSPSVQVGRKGGHHRVAGFAPTWRLCYLQTISLHNGSRMDRYGQYVKGQHV